VNVEFSLSTCWCSHRHNDGYEMVREMVDLGFNSIELSHGIKLTLAPGILKAVEEGLVRISSTHNFCPLPHGVTQAAPNLYEPSAAEDRERDQWVRQTKRSIDFAVQVEAPIVVCHLGSVRFFLFNPARRLLAYARRHPNAKIPHDPEYRELLAKSFAKVRKKMGPYWENVKDSVAQVLDYALEKGVKLGFENRERLEELPLDDDYVGFLSSFPADAPVGYWHDTGHADIKASMGLLDHRGQLEKLSPRLLGFHLHDVTVRRQDHQPVGSGHIDFKMISEFWRPDHALVLELNPRIPIEAVRTSRERLLALAM
jgi:sugar phosphate isomerase/epimerase